MKQSLIAGGAVTAVYAAFSLNETAGYLVLLALGIAAIIAGGMQHMMELDR